MLKLEILVGGLENVSYSTADATKTAVHLSHVTYSQAPAVCEKKNFPLISFYSASGKLQVFPGVVSLDCIMLSLD